MADIKFQFNSDQQFQLDAIRYTLRVLEGTPVQVIKSANLMDAADVVSNFPENKDLNSDDLLENLCSLQQEQIENAEAENNRIDLSISQELFTDYGPMLEGVSNDQYLFPHFSVEMETGTGKTYVYLRTVYELYQQYGFTKFMIVVPSVAIRLGVIKGFEDMKDHFHSLYGNSRVQMIEYDGSKLGQLRAFANEQDVQIMVITMQAFNSASNNIYKPTEKLQGEWLPYQYIQACRPILILDEPQNMESDKSRQALRTLRPLFALRYSATFKHKDKENFLYKLTPVEAFQQGLVKRIQVVGVEEEDNLQQEQIVLKELSKKGSTFQAELITYVLEKGRKIRKSFSLKQREDLFEKTKNPDFKQGYKVDNISLMEGDSYLEFTNGIKLFLNEESGTVSKESVFRYQIQETIKHHFERQQKLLNKAVKVLSLFFVDKVANFINNGIIKRIFDQEFNRLKKSYSEFKELNPDQVQASYFASYRNKKTNEEEYIDTDGKNDSERNLEKEQFDLIMKKKKELLSFDQKTSFIFAHSALREGWDNPNVFQICTLNQTVSLIRKRQEIGRGLRICVNQDGQRLFGNDINILTVIANESYESFAAGLQQEYQEDGGMAPPNPTDVKRHKKEAKRRDELFYSEHFKSFWEKLLRPLRYKIKIDTKALVKKCLSTFERRGNELFKQPKVMMSEGQFELSRIRFELIEISEGKAKVTVSLDNKITLGTLDKTYTFELDEKSDMEQMVKKSQNKDVLMPLFRGFKVNAIKHKGTIKSVEFKNGYIISNFEDLVYPVSTIKAKTKKELGIVNANTAVPLTFNLYKRAAEATGLTIATVKEIYTKMSMNYKVVLLQNPDVFSNNFISIVQNVLAEHVAEHIEFVVNDDAKPLYELSELFPEIQSYVQSEVLESNEKGLYDLVQKDSEVEHHFVENCLHTDEELLIYFKFPSKFRLQFPKVIHNYNPDWGVLRELTTPEGKKMVVELVRETKGTIDVQKLRFLGEQRKIEAAMKYFGALGIDYRVVDDKVEEWWEKDN
jgi:type III restriction enzyme